MLGRSELLDGRGYGRGAYAKPFGATPSRSQYGLVHHRYSGGGIPVLTRGVRGYGRGAYAKPFGANSM